MAEKEAGGSSLTAFLLGATVGAVVAILFAPRSGRETRERISDWMESLEDKGQELMEEGRDLWEQGKATAQEKAEKIKETVESATRKVWDRA